MPSRRIKDFSNKIKDKISNGTTTIATKVHIVSKEEPKNLQVIKKKLSQNSLVELRLGYDDIDFYSKRDVFSLIKVIKEQFLPKLILDKHSCLTSICIGWKLPSFAIGPILQQVIPLLLQEPIHVTHIQLALRNNTPIPKPILRRIVTWPILECLDLRSIRIITPIYQQSATSMSTMRSTPATTSSTATSYAASASAALPSLSSSGHIYSNSHHHHHRQYHHHHGNNSNYNSTHYHHHNHPQRFFDNDDLLLSDSCHLNGSTSSSTTTLSSDDIIWKEENVIKIVPYISLNVKTLKLVDCNIRSYHIPELCDIIRRYKMNNIQELNLRHNRNLDGGYYELFALPCIKSLDLSLCDLDPSDGYHIVNAMKQHCCCERQTTNNDENQENDTDNSNNQKKTTSKNYIKAKNNCKANKHIRRLNLAGNYRMSDAIPDIVQFASTCLVELDCSFCDVQSKLQRKVFKILATVKNCTLQSFRMQGTRINDVTGLVECIENNTSLQCLVLNHPREPHYIHKKGMEQILDAMKLNYSIYVLKLDTYQCVDIWQSMNFWLQLNNCGRKFILQNNSEQRTKSWSTILGEAANHDDINILYWLLKHGSTVMFTCP